MRRPAKTAGLRKGECRNAYGREQKRSRFGNKPLGRTVPERLLPTFLPRPLHSGRARRSFVLVSFLWFVSLDRQRNERKI